MNIVMEDFRVKEISMEHIPNGVYLKPGIRLKSSAFIESVMPEIYRATDRVRTPKKTAAEMDRTIVSCIIGNLVAGGKTPVIIKLSNNQKYPGLSQKQLKRIIETLDPLGWISLTKGVWRGDAGMITKRNLDLGGLEISRGTEDEIVVRKKKKAQNPAVYFENIEMARMKAELRDMNNYYTASDLNDRGIR